jgi:hypothetical protein
MKPIALALTIIALLAIGISGFFALSRHPQLVPVVTGSAPIVFPPDESDTVVAPPVAPTADFLIYDDTLRNNFQDWSWAPHALDNPAPVYEGITSIRVDYAGDYDGVWFVNRDGGTSTTGYSALRFAIHGGTTGGQAIRVTAGSGENFPESNSVNLNNYLSGGPVANQWREVTIPLADMNMAFSTLANVAFQSGLGGAQPTFYIDDIRLLGEANPTNPAITIEPTGTITPVNPLIFGSNLPTWLGNRLENPTFRARSAATGVTILRLPGGSYSNNYDWLACETGDVANCMVGDWGATPTDFIEFLQATDIEGMWVVSPNGTPEEAAALVAFFNSEVGDTTPIGVDREGRDWGIAGDWAQLRADHGNPDPFPIRYWEVGNELYGSKPQYNPQCASYGWEDYWTCDGTEYMNGDSTRAGYLEFRAAMREIDPMIEVGAVGIPHPAEWNAWGNEVLAAGGTELDFYSLHEYAFDTSPDYGAILSSPHPNWDGIRADLDSAIATHANGRNVPMAVTEYNLISVGDNDTGAAMTRAVNALFIADTLGQLIEKGFFLANHWDLANGAFGNGTDYGLVHADTFSRYPQYYIFPLWTRFGGHMIPSTNNLPDTTLVVYAGRVDGDTLSLIALNKTGQPLTADLAVTGRTITGGTVDTLQAESLGATTVTYNGNPNPEDDLSDAPSTPLTVSGETIVYDFPAYSVTLLHLDISGNPAPFKFRNYLPTMWGKE